MDKVKNIIKEYLPYVIVLLIVILLKTFVFTMVIVHGTSMNDTLHNKDVMILNKIGLKTSKIERFDIVVINYDKTKIIKRVIGLPGEMVEYYDGVLYINNKEQDTSELDIYNQVFNNTKQSNLKDLRDAINNLSASDVSEVLKYVNNIGGR